MVVLADTSVWISHFKSKKDFLIDLLEDDRVIIHPSVIGELACGVIPRRMETLQDLRLLPRATELNAEEVLEMVETRHLYNKGLGWVDMQLIASTLVSNARLITYDKKLTIHAKAMGILFSF